MIPKWLSCKIRTLIFLLLNCILGAYEAFTLLLYLFLHFGDSDVDMRLLFLSCIYSVVKSFHKDSKLVANCFSLAWWIGYRLATDGQEFFTSYDEVYDSFDSMGLQENLLRGIYAYGTYSHNFFSSF